MKFTGIEEILTKKDKIENSIINTIRAFIEAEQEMVFGNRRRALECISIGRMMIYYFPTDEDYKKYKAIIDIIPRAYAQTRKKYFKYFKNERPF